MKAKETIKAWHFVQEDRRMQYDSSQIIEVGKTYTVDCEPILCRQGLHASVSVLDALRYVPGPILCKVEIAGDIVQGHDKIAGTERTVIAMADVSDVLNEFARKVALDVIHLWDAPKVVVDYLTSGDETLKDAAMAAAWDAARDAARAAARDAARAAARDAAWDSARAAARDAAMAAARDAAWSAARDAAWSAARDAAWSAGRAIIEIKQNQQLEALLEKVNWETQ